MLTVLRAYAEEWQLHDQAIEMLCFRRAQHFAAFAEQVRAGLLGKDQGQWLDRIVLEENNLPRVARLVVPRGRRCSSGGPGVGTDPAR